MSKSKTKRPAKAVRQYQFRSGTSLPVPAQEVGAELERIEARDGGIAPCAVVDAARPEQAPLHPCFEWNDEVAAEKYREEVQAGRVIRSVRVVYQNDEGQRRPYPAFLSVQVVPEGQEEPQRRYLSSSRVLSDPKLRDQALAEAREAFLLLRRRFAHLGELAELLAAVDAAFEATP